MKTDYVKKGLAIGVIVLFVCAGIIPNITAYNSIKFSDLNENVASKINEKPDLIITGVFIFQITGEVSHSVDFEYNCRIENIGESSVVEPTIWVEVDVYRAQIFKPDKFYGSYQGKSELCITLEPGEAVFIGFLISHFHYFPDYFLRFECHCYCNFDEENLGNNYFNKTYFYYHNLFVWGLIPIPILF